jgi:cytochrome c oxidase subunit 1
MSTIGTPPFEGRPHAEDARPLADSERPRINYLNVDHSVRSWLLTKDHKRIAILYLVSISFFFMVGGVYAGLIRLELLTPQSDLMTASTYNKTFTQHGIIMIFFS